ncbi:hypothetical protein FisN_17Lh086 [Fistulifera solaris]|uniref:Ubiquitin-like domain-containing protein n=1 Tax=Fistulifera solaris TaxID=1519565 RepID=A0A1Z5K1J5_FISSO|nr:hypothetical protein FisN_17Lh086 [Fistulifera solaris]|eukprot:GAX20135.1 hypothetical protein FisN_17Lh086 [Fistulifera solaris]
MASTIAMSNSGLWLPGVANTKEDKIEKWWEVNRKHDPPLTRGATPLVERCMRVLGWNEVFAKRTLKGYRQFMELKSVMNDWQATKLTAPLAIQQMWEQHLLDNLNYTDDCFLLFGRVIGNDPDAILNERLTLDRVKTTKIAFQARYGHDLDPEVWDYGHAEVDAIDGDDHAMAGVHHHHHHVPSSPRGRLPVAGVAHETSPRSRSHIVAPSEDEAVENTPARRSLTKNPRSPKSPPTGNDPITIFLRDSASGEETYFSLRYRSTLRIVFTVFAERKGLSQENLKFAFNGQTLTGYETPYSLGLEDRARIDVTVGMRRG